MIEPPAVGDGAEQTRTGQPDSSASIPVTGSQSKPAEGMPRWARVLGIIGIALALVIVVMLLTGHGPGQHMHGSLGGHAPAYVATNGGGAVVRPWS